MKTQRVEVEPRVESFDLNGESGESGKKYYFEMYTHSDFVSNALVITTDPEDKIIGMFFNTAELGTADIDHEHGLVSCHSWESEDSAKETSFLARNYPIILHNGFENADFAKRIMTLVLENIGSQYLMDITRKFCDKKSDDVYYNSEVGESLF